MSSKQPSWKVASSRRRCSLAAWPSSSSALAEGAVAPGLVALAFLGPAATVSRLLLSLAAPLLSAVVWFPCTIWGPCPCPGATLGEKLPLRNFLLLLQRANLVERSLKTNAPNSLGLGKPAFCHGQNRPATLKRRSTPAVLEDRIATGRKASKAAA